MFKRLILAAVLTSSSFAAPTLLIATPAAAVPCPETAPEGFKRAGGFCELRNQTATLAPSLTSKPVEPTPTPAPTGCSNLWELKLLPVGDRVLTAC